jgi:aspartyl-tRNA(Asn)/glutamyl-tRNA(Gln) amidotransferase subunit A
MHSPIPKTIASAKELFISGELTPTQLVEHYFSIIKEKNPNLNAVLEVFDDALVNAKESDERYKNKTQRKLEGIPFLVKDCILVKGHKASAGSQMLKNYIAPYDSTAIKLIKDEGGIILGRTNMDEFALGGSGENSSYGKTLNPINTEHVPGGTSSGSAAALASGMCLVALGTDTGGSVRQPASFCGVVGFKPSYGFISRSGLIAAASSLEGIGVLANSCTDAQEVFNVISREDILDNTTTPDSLRDKLRDKKPTKKVFYPKTYIDSEGVNEEVKENFYKQLEKLKVMGYEVEEVSFETLKYALSVYYIINTAEVSTNLSRMDGLRFGGGEVGEVKSYKELFSKNRGVFLGPEVKRRIMLGSYVLSHGYYDAFYGKAQNLRAKMVEEFDKLFESGTYLLMPVAPTPAWKIGSIKDPLTLYLEDIFTVPANLAGITGISIPSGFSKDGLPLGLQVLCGYGQEENLFNFSKNFLSE